VRAHSGQRLINMAKFFKTLSLVIVAVLLLSFALANREVVTFVIDPTGITGAQITAPLFILAFVFLIAGVIVGGVAAWVRQSKWRRSSRALDHEVSMLRSDNDALRRQIDTLHAAAGDPEAARLTLRSPAA
jgi:uncharacterized integral membrane protein